LTTKIANTRPPDSDKNSIRRSTATFRFGTVTTQAIDDKRDNRPDTACSMSVAVRSRGTNSSVMRFKSASLSGSGASRLSTK